MEKMKRNIEIRERASEIEKVLKDHFDTKIKIAWTIGEDNTFIIDKYINEYDYRRYHVKDTDELHIKEYIYILDYADKEEKYKLHKACKMEKMLIGLLDGLEYCHLYDGEIYSDDDIEGIRFCDITNAKVDMKKDELMLDLDDEYFFSIDLATGKVTEITDKIEELKEKIELLNILKPYGSNIQLDDKGNIKVRYGSDKEYGIIGHINDLQSIDIDNVSFDFGDESMVINEFGIEM